jgi:uncharacterized protein (TIGR02996 family)
VSDGDHLLHAILSDPADDAPRLIYADWLDENGDPDRASWIRDSIRSGVVSYHTTGCFEPFMCIIPDLPLRHGGEQLDPSWRGWRWHRGFVFEYHDIMAELLANGPALARVQPVERFIPTDKRPWHNPPSTGEWGDWVWMRQGAYLYSPPSDVLPDPAFAALDGQHYHAIPGNWCDYKTEADALDALARAVTLIVHEKAGAPLSV